MSRRLGLWYTLFSIVALIALAILALARLNTTRSINLDGAEATYRRFHTEVTEAIGDPQLLRETIRSYRAAVPTLDAVVIYDPDAGIRYFWAADPDLVAFSDANLSQARGFPSFHINEIAQHYISEHLPAPDTPGLYLDAVYTILTFSDAYLPLRDSLIALLAFALLTLLVALAANTANKTRDDSDDESRERSRRTDPWEPRSAARHGRDSRGPEPQGPDPQGYAREPYSAAPAPAIPREPAGSVSQSDAAAPRSNAPAPETHAARPEPVMEEVELEELATEPGEPGTLFSAITGLSYREHLDRRLGLELERAAYNDQDLTCLMIRFEDLGGSEEEYVDRAGLVLSTFQFEDLCFEYDRTTFCVILPNTDLTQGLRAAEAFRGSNPGRIAIGLSARNGRLVEASRVLNEALRSLDHAARERQGIVGFRPDPKKYRQFITGRIGPTT